MRDLIQAAFAGLGLALLASPVFAQDEEPLVTDRPDFTESVLAVAPGRVQLESGVTFTWSDADELTIGEPLVRAGLVEGLELRVEAPSWIDGTEGEGLGDPTVGLKLELPPALNAELALIAGTTVPLGDDDVGEDAWHPEAVLGAAWELSERFGLSTNVGAATESDGDSRQLVSWASVSLGAALTEATGGYLEAYGFADEDGAGPAFVDGGLTRLLGTNLQLDARVGVGLFQAAGDVFVGAGVSQRW